MSKKVCIIGLDCAPPDLVFEKWKNDLPNLQGIDGKGDLWTAEIDGSSDHDSRLDIDGHE